MDKIEQPRLKEQCLNCIHFTGCSCKMKLDWIMAEQWDKPYKCDKFDQRG